MKDLAVIMAVYKGDSLTHLKKSINSILDQTYGNFDLYIYRDGPINNETEEFLKSINDDRIIRYNSEINKGLAHSLNYLLNQILPEKKYRFIARMDADDISLADRLYKQRRFLIDNPDIACLGTWVELIDENDNHISFKYLPTYHEKLKRRFIIKSPFVHSSVMMRAALFKKAGYYPTNTILMEDNILWGNALNIGLKFGNIPEYLLLFRINKEFYRRRSGIKYGFNYIKVRFEMISRMNLPFYSYLFSLIIGIIKMLPALILKRIYMHDIKRLKRH